MMSEPKRTDWGSGTAAVAAFFWPSTDKDARARAQVAKLKAYAQAESPSTQQHHKHQNSHKPALGSDRNPDRPQDGHPLGPWYAVPRDPTASSPYGFTLLNTPAAAGIRVCSVDAGSAAAVQGIEPNIVITEINGVTVLGAKHGPIVRMIAESKGDLLVRFLPHEAAFRAIKIKTTLIPPSKEFQGCPDKAAMPASVLTESNHHPTAAPRVGEKTSRATPFLRVASVIEPASPRVAASPGTQSAPNQEHGEGQNKISDSDSRPPSILLRENDGKVPLQTISPRRQPSSNGSSTSRDHGTVYTLPRDSTASNPYGFSLLKTPAAAGIRVFFVDAGSAAAVQGIVANMVVAEINGVKVLGRAHAHIVRLIALTKGDLQVRFVSRPTATNAVVPPGIGQLRQRRRSKTTSPSTSSPSPAAALTDDEVTTANSRAPLLGRPRSNQSAIPTSTARRPARCTKTPPTAPDSQRVPQRNRRHVSATTPAQSPTSPTRTQSGRCSDGGGGDGGGARKPGRRPSSTKPESQIKRSLPPKRMCSSSEPARRNSVISVNVVNRVDGVPTAGDTGSDTAEDTAASPTGGTLAAASHSPCPVVSTWNFDSDPIPASRRRTVTIHNEHASQHTPGGSQMYMDYSSAISNGRRETTTASAERAWSADPHRVPRMGLHCEGAESPMFAPSCHTSPAMQHPNDEGEFFERRPTYTFNFGSPEDEMTGVPDLWLPSDHVHSAVRPALPLLDGVLAGGVQLEISGSKLYPDTMGLYHELDTTYCGRPLFGRNTAEGPYFLYFAKRAGGGHWRISQEIGQESTKICAFSTLRDPLSVEAWYEAIGNVKLNLTQHQPRIITQLSNRPIPPVFDVVTQKAGCQEIRRKRVSNAR